MVVSTISLVKNTSPDIIFANMTYRLISILINLILVIVIVLSFLVYDVLFLNKYFFQWNIYD